MYRLSKKNQKTNHNKKEMQMNPRNYILTALILLLAASGCSSERQSLIAPGAEVQKLAGGFAFTEGPAADKEGNIFFSDIPNNRIHKWSLDGKLSTFKEDSGGANGLFFDDSGTLFVCEGGRRRLVSIDPRGNMQVLVEKYKNKKFNSPNDLWLHPKGGIYFTDPCYGNRDKMEQDGEHVYYLSPDRKKVLRVIDDMIKPNGVIGTGDGKLLYVTDHGGDNTFVYKINSNGTLSNKKLFAPESSDGMTIDNKGNIYLTSMPASTLSDYDTGQNPVTVYDSSGRKIETILIPERPTNVSFGGPDKKTLFITAQKSLYSVKMRVNGL
jgi:gluconolactonase